MFKLYFYFDSAFWRYKRDTIETIDPNIPDLRAFVSDMMDSFFKDSMSLVCFPFKMKQETICSYYPPDSAEGQIRESILMNMVDAISKITYIVL